MNTDVTQPAVSILLAAFAVSLLATGTAFSQTATPAPADAPVGMFPTLDEQYDRYLAFKKNLLDEHGIKYGMLASSFGQWATPHGGPGTASMLITPTISWAPFTNTPIGSGAFTVSYSQAQYFTHANGQNMQQKLGVLAQVNDWEYNQFQWTQITYTHTLPGDLVAVSVGQFSLTNFDSNEFAGNQQTNFFNYALSQNGTQAYPNAGLGGYVTLTPTKEITLSGGMQGATNLGGNIVSPDGYRQGKYAYFAYAQWTPTFSGFGPAQYSLLWYDQPAVTAAPSKSQGVSFNAVQHVNADWGVFVRASNASGNTPLIRTSVAAGVVYTDPFGLNPLDQVGVGVGWNLTNKAAYGGQGVRSSETVGEVYYNYTIFKGLQIAPDVQVYFNPAIAPKSSTAAIVSLRATATF